MKSIKKSLVDCCEVNKEGFLCEIDQRCLTDMGLMDSD